MLGNNIIICQNCSLRSPVIESKIKCTVNNNNIVENARENECPKGYYKSEMSIKITNFIKAQLTGKRVSLQVAQQRYKTCLKCDKLKTKNGIQFCGILSCGCKVKPKESAIIKSLTEIEENLPHWGCKHPERNQGKGWSF